MLVISTVEYEIEILTHPGTLGDLYFSTMVMLHKRGSVALGRRYIRRKRHFLHAARLLCVCICGLHCSNLKFRFLLQDCFSEMENQ